MKVLLLATVAVVGAALFSALALLRIIKLQRDLHFTKQRQAHWFDQVDKATEVIQQLDCNSPRKLVEAVSKITGFKGWFLETKNAVVSVEMVSNTPFWVDPYLATMALRSEKTVKQQQLTRWGWACVYIPITVSQTTIGLIAVAASREISPEDLQFEAMLAELICISWASRSEANDGYISTVSSLGSSKSISHS